MTKSMSSQGPHGQSDGYGVPVYLVCCPREEQSHVHREARRLVVWRDLRRILLQLSPALFGDLWGC